MSEVWLHELCRGLVVYTMHNGQCTISGAAGRCDLSGRSASPTQHHRRLTSGRLRSPVWRRPPLLGPAVRGASNEYTALATRLATRR